MNATRTNAFDTPIIKNGNKYANIETSRKKQLRKMQQLQAQQEAKEEEKRLKQLIRKSGAENVQIAKYAALPDEKLSEKIRLIKDRISHTPSISTDRATGGVADTAIMTRRSNFSQINAPKKMTSLKFMVDNQVYASTTKQQSVNPQQNRIAQLSKTSKFMSLAQMYDK